MSMASGVRTIPHEHWVSLDLALAWICFDEAFDLQTLRSTAKDRLGMTDDDARKTYQSAWIQLADAAFDQKFVVCGRRVQRRLHEQYVRPLSGEDLLNCRFVDFLLFPEGATILLSRHDRDYDSAYDGLLNESGWDFTHVVIRREDLLKFKSQARPKAVRRKTSRANGLAALEFLKRKIEERGAHEIRRDALLQEMCEQFGITQETARQNWKAATADRADLRRPGRRKRGEAQSNQEI